MPLVDTSIWVDHLRAGDRLLARQLDAGDVFCHPLVIGEIACGRLQDRDNVLALLNRLPLAVECTHAEALTFIDRHALGGSGLGIVDIHLLASARLTGLPIWSRDRALTAAARTLGLAYS